MARMIIQLCIKLPMNCFNEQPHSLLRGIENEIVRNKLWGIRTVRD